MPPAVRSRSHGRPLDRCRVSEAGLYCTEIHTSASWACWQLDSGKSIRRNRPANGTAGFARVAMSNSSRLPAPPARINTSTVGNAMGPSYRYPAAPAVRPAHRSCRTMATPSGPRPFPATTNPARL
jgi:hypothetical protein